MDVGQILCCLPKVFYYFLACIFSCFKTFVDRWWKTLMVLLLIVILLKVQKRTKTDLGLSVVFWAVFLIALSNLVKLLYFFISYCLSLGRIIPIETLANLPLYKDVQIKYHLFISIHERDYQNLKDFIAELESRGLGLFVTCRDITPGESMISTNATAIIYSALYMVVASADYLKDPGLNNFQIDMILSKTTPKNLLVFKQNACSVSEIFAECFTLVDATKLTRHEVMQTVNHWIDSHLCSVLRKLVLTLHCLRFLFAVHVVNACHLIIHCLKALNGEPFDGRILLIYIAILVLVIVASTKLAHSSGYLWSMFLSWIGATLVQWFRRSPYSGIVRFRSLRCCNP